MNKNLLEIKISGLFFFIEFLVNTRNCWYMTIRVTTTTTTKKKKQCNSVICAQVLSHVQLCNFMDCNLAGSSVLEIFPDKNTGTGYHALLQGIFPTQGLNPFLLWLLHWQEDSLLLGHLGSQQCNIIQVKNESEVFKQVKDARSYRIPTSIPFFSCITLPLSLH